jgi:hypothetical protein
MQTKTLSRVFAVVMAVALIALAPLFFAGCDAQISANDAVKNAKNATNAYISAHTNPSNFADATYASTTKNVEVEFATVDNVKKETVTTTTTEKTLSIKRDSNVISAKLVVLQKTTEQVNVLAGEQGQINTTLNKKIEFNIGVLNQVPYITKTETDLLADSNANPTKEFGQFTGSEDYNNKINQLIDFVNYGYDTYGDQHINGTADFLAELGTAINKYNIFADLSFTKSGDTTKIAYSTTTYGLADYSDVDQAHFIYDETNSLDLTFSNNSASYSTLTKTTTPRTPIENINTFSYKSGADAATIVTEGYTEANANTLWGQAQGYCPNAPRII